MCQALAFHGTTMGTEVPWWGHDPWEAAPSAGPRAEACQGRAKQTQEPLVSRLHGDCEDPLSS